MPHTKRIVTTRNADRNPLNGLLVGTPYRIQRGEDWDVLVMSDGEPPNDFAPFPEEDDAVVLWLQHEGTGRLADQKAWIDAKFPRWRVRPIPFHHGDHVYRRYFDLVMQLKDAVAGDEVAYEKLLRQLDHRLLGRDVEGHGAMLTMYLFLAKWHAEALLGDPRNAHGETLLEAAIQGVESARAELYLALAPLGADGKEVQEVVENNIRDLNEPEKITDENFRAIREALLSRSPEK